MSDSQEEFEAAVRETETIAVADVGKLETVFGGAAGIPDPPESAAFEPLQSNPTLEPLQAAFVQEVPLGVYLAKAKTQPGTVPHFLEAFATYSRSSGLVRKSMAAWTREFEAFLSRRVR